MRHKQYMTKEQFLERFGSFDYANIHYTGSVRGMKNLGYWNKHDRCIRCGKYIYNVDRPVKD